MTPPHIPPGTVLRLAGHEWGYSATPRPLTFRVDRVRDDLTVHTSPSGELWVEGWELDPAGQRMQWRQILVRIAAVEPAMTRTQTTPRSR